MDVNAGLDLRDGNLYDYYSKSYCRIYATQNACKLWTLIYN